MNVGHPRAKEWLTVAEAALVTGRAKRTLRLWVKNSRTTSNPTLRIRQDRDDDGALLLNRDDLLRVQAFKDAYRDTPTFGRA